MLTNTQPMPIGSSNKGSKRLAIAKYNSNKPTAIIVACPMSMLAMPESINRFVILSTIHNPQIIQH
ncbi:hypothetical protein IMCC1989_1957 [gamma proteobacterium IMCC1989]|nr:hypothetical protein IMCC1989_1957 [gamma proteobacterium IMCC1989]